MSLIDPKYALTRFIENCPRLGLPLHSEPADFLSFFGVHAEAAEGAVSRHAAAGAAHEIRPRQDS